MTDAASPSPRNGLGHSFQSRRAGRVDSAARRGFAAVLASGLSPAETPRPSLERPGIAVLCGLTGTRRPPAARRPAAPSPTRVRPSGVCRASPGFGGAAGQAAPPHDKLNDILRQHQIEHIFKDPTIQ
ncbi:hypothetical protein HispidOSU_020863, partial [Sigmodon hispidus]